MRWKWDHRKRDYLDGMSFAGLVPIGSLKLQYIQTSACNIGLCSTIVIVLVNVYDGARRLVLPFDVKMRLLLARGLTVILTGLKLLTI
jgi:hypothetical protein